MEVPRNKETAKDESSSQPRPLVTVHSVCSYLLQRHAFFAALAMSMLFAERESKNRNEGVPKAYIYIHLGALLATGSVMSFGAQKSLFAVLGAGFTAFFCITTHLIQDAELKQWLVMRMIFHDVAIIGVYLILASRHTEKLTKRFRLLWLYPYGKICLSIFFVFIAFQLHRNTEEQEVLLKNFSFGHIVNFALSSIFMICGLLLSSDWNLRTISRILIGALALYIILVEGAFTIGIIESRWSIGIKLICWGTAALFL